MSFGDDIQTMVLLYYLTGNRKVIRSRMAFDGSFSLQIHIKFCFSSPYSTSQISYRSLCPEVTG
jgi:hypothetical protein